MAKMAEVNGTRMPTEDIASAAPSEPKQPAGTATATATVSVEEGGAQHKPAAAAPQQNGSLMSMLRDKHIARRFIILSYAWMILCMTYYGISLALNGLKVS